MVERINVLYEEKESIGWNCIINKHLDDILNKEREFTICFEK